MKIHLVKTRLVNSYIAEYPDKLLVMDVALRCHRYVLGYIAENLGRDIRDVRLVVCSHDDPDHIGGVAALAAHSGAEIGIPHASGSFLRKALNDPTGGAVRFGTAFREAFRARAWNMYANPERSRQARKQPRLSTDNPEAETAVLQPDFRLKHRSLLPGFQDWQVIHTPGHSWDSCCFYHAASGSLISGDTLLGSGKKGRLVVPSIYSNKRQTRLALQRLTGLDIRAVYPGHGSPFYGEGLLEAVK